MSTYDIIPVPIQTLTSDEQIRAYVNPTRMTILAMLAKEKNSVSGIARQLGVHPANLTHHFKLLEKVGLIELVEKRETGKNLEKYYRAKAYHFVVSAGEQPSGQKALALSILRDNLDAALRTVADPADERIVLGAMKTVRLHPADVEKFAQKLLDLLGEFEEHAAETGEVYSLNVSLYPAEAANLSAPKVTIHIEGK
ncbi:MAG TPA: helix-turn-helix domain-containing protein [Anaerolineae bacterium]|nr:helix-turn-helix domain-containing protein [Anaerolineae bacterium]